jgi:chromosome segregation ATPase
VDEIKGQLTDCEKRILQLETSFEVGKAEIASLRASRHEHGNWLNRHNLEINELNTKLMQHSNSMNSLSEGMKGMELKLHEFQVKLISELSSIRASFNEDIVQIQTHFDKELSNQKSDLRQTMWAVGLITSLIFFVMKAALAKYGF